MRAWIHTKPCHPSQLALSNDVPQPSITKPTQVLVRITHASLNPGGSIILQLCPAFVRTKPCIPELDFAGTIVTVGDGVPARRGLRQGLGVFGSVTVAEHMKGSGALAEYVVVNHNTVVPLPSNANAESAVGLTVAGSTALELIDAAAIHAGMRVLVNGVSGGIGSMAVQLVKGLVGEDGRVVGICSGRNVELAKSLGCDEVIDYGAHHPLTKFLSEQYSSQPFNLIIDAYGIQDLYTDSPKYLSPMGSFVTVGIAFKQYTYSSMLVAVASMMMNSLLPRKLGGTARKYIQVTGVAELEKMERLKTLVEEGKLRPVVDSVWSLEDVPKAYETMLSRRAKGKIVIKIQD